MKKLFSLFMAAVTSLSLAACSAGSADSYPTEQDQGFSQTEVLIETDEEALTDEALQTDRDTPTAETAQGQIPSAEQEQTVESAYSAAEDVSAQTIDENGSFTDKDDVALYIHTYGHLPKNFITKAEARELGWGGGSVEDYAPGMCIGGDRFGNYEGLLPEKSGRSYTECDIDTLGKSGRGAKRIIFSNDGLIYYTDDHYESFTLLYGEE